MDMSAEDFELFYSYANSYGISDNFKSSREGIKYALSEWKLQKNEYLFKIFGGALIIKKPFTFQKVESEIISQMCQVYYHSNLPGYVKIALQKYAIEDRVIQEPSFMDRVRFSPTWYHIADALFNIDALVENKLQMDLSFSLINGGCVKVKRGTKVIRAIRTVIDKLNECIKDECEKKQLLDELEVFRNKHALVFNDLKITGNLCLSIHPMDYATMSDNSNGWTSCMSWRDFGGYHAGTLEMMNSPCVVVAYVESPNNISVPDGMWNNKKWRELFVITEDIIIADRGYPYGHSSLEQEVVLWLKQIAENTMGWKYSDAPVSLSVNTGYPDPELNIRVDIQSELMYNDFNEGHMSVLKEGLNHSIDINFSGTPLCLVCGNEIHIEDSLCCRAHTNTCCDCGSSIGPNQSYALIDDQMYCEECEERLTECDLCGAACSIEDIQNLNVKNDEDDNNDEGREYNFSLCPECQDRLLELGEIKERRLSQPYGGIAYDYICTEKISPDTLKKLLENT